MSVSLPVRWFLVLILCTFSLGAGTTYVLIPKYTGPNAHTFLRDDVIIGKVEHIADGDTFTVTSNRGNVRIRIRGLAAPEVGGHAKDTKERAQGERAQAWMKDHVLHTEVHCKVADKARSFDRIVAVCTNEHGDIAANIITAGLARACPHMGGKEYLKYEPKSAEDLPLPRYCRES